MSGPVALAADTANKTVLRRRHHIGAICEAWLWNSYKYRLCLDVNKWQQPITWANDIRVYCAILSQWVDTKPVP